MVRVAMSINFNPDESWWSLLCSVDTPTVCNAIEVAQGQRGFDNFTRRTMLCADDTLPAICGYARTTRIKAVEPPREPAGVIKRRRMEYYRYMSLGARPAVVVIEDVDWPDCLGAYWGQINIAIHAGFKLAGAVINGVMRDLGDLHPGFQVIANSIGPSHGFVYVLDFQQPVSFLGLSVSHGALVIQPGFLLDLADSIEELKNSEALILDPAREDEFNFEKFKLAWSRFEKACTQGWNPDANDSYLSPTPLELRCRCHLDRPAKVSDKISHLLSGVKTLAVGHLIFIYTSCD